MNIFRLIGDLLHLLSILLLIRKIVVNRNCAGISLLSIQLYAIVFVTRYLDLLYSFISVYNSTMKVFYIFSTFYLIYLLKVRFRVSYDKDHDKFPILYLIVPSFVLALIINEEFNITEIIWTFSIYLEAVAILPQLFMLQRTGEVDMLTADYVFSLGGYRFFYILNWVCRYYNDGYTDYIVWAAGIVQTAIYGDFFYYYLRSKYYGVRIVLPQ